jgi:chromosome segregation ATPase
MSTNKILTVICILFLTTSLFSSIANPQTAANSSANAGQSEQSTQALLNEVRQLRLAIQQLSLSGYRSQVIVERLRSQQQRVDRLSDRLRETRDRIAGLKREQYFLQDELKRIENRLNRATEFAERTTLEEQQERLKSRLDDQARESTRMQEQESQFAGQLNLEQGKLAEFNDQLDSLQRELETRPR